MTIINNINSNINNENISNNILIVIMTNNV